MDNTENNKVNLSNDLLLWAYRIDPTGSGTAIQFDEIKIAQSDNSYVWVHLRSDGENAYEQLKSLGLDGKIIDALTTSETRPKAMRLEGGAVLVLRGVNMNHGADPEDMISIRMWFNKNMVITSRRSKRNLLSILDVKDSVDSGAGPKTTGEFITTVVEQLASRIGDLVETIDQDLLTIESDFSVLELSPTRQKLSELRYQVATIRRHLAPQRVALDTLFRDGEILTASEAHDLHFQTDLVIKYVEDLDLARERGLVLQEQLQYRVAEEQNLRMYVLSIVAAIFLPLSFLTGVFGMNVAGLPGTENPNAFLILSAFMIVVGILLMIFMRWKKWL